MPNLEPTGSGLLRMGPGIKIIVPSFNSEYSEFLKYYANLNNFNQNAWYS